MDQGFEMGIGNIGTPNDIDQGEELFFTADGYAPIEDGIPGDRDGELVRHLVAPCLGSLG